jgi:methylmalonyl-CoA mutase cobalamin-binding domain/chain
MIPEYESNVDAKVQKLLNLILEGEHDEAKNYLNKQIEETSVSDVINDVLEPALMKIGELWNKEKVSLAAGYLAGKLAEEILEKSLEEVVESTESKGVAVVGNVEDDYHSLGRKLLSAFLRISGWQVVDLGNDVLADEFVDAALEHDAHVIGVSAMMFATAENIKLIRQELDKRNLSNNIKLAVGGAVFKLNPNLVDEVGGDGTAANAAEAPALFDSLIKKVQ